MRKRTAYTLLFVFVILCGLAAVLYLRGKAPPEAARLLPESDAIVYLNLKPLRAATHFDRNPVAPSDAYKQFSESTGIVLERDLDSAAFALQGMPDARGPNGPVAFSEVFVGRFDTDRLTKYLAAQATSQETYAGHIIYSLPSESRTVRVVILGYDIVAVSNTPTPEQLHSILDRSRAAASPFSGCSLLNDRYADIPAFSSAWAIGHIGLAFAKQGKITLLGLELPLSTDTTFVASLRYTTGLHLRIDQIVSSEAEAAHSAQSLNGLLTLFRGLQTAQQPTPRTPEEIAIRQFTDSIAIEPHKDRATLTATLPSEALKHLTNEPQ